MRTEIYAHREQGFGVGRHQSRVMATTVRNYPRWAKAGRDLGRRLGWIIKGRGALYEHDGGRRKREREQSSVRATTDGRADYERG